MSEGTHETYLLACYWNSLHLNLFIFADGNEAAVCLAGVPRCWFLMSISIDMNRRPLGQQAYALVSMAYFLCFVLIYSMLCECLFLGVLLYLPMNMANKWRLGGSSLAQCFRQLGNEVPDVETQTFVNTFAVVQTLIKGKFCQRLQVFRNLNKMNFC